MLAYNKDDMNLSSKKYCISYSLVDFSFISKLCSRDSDARPYLIPIHVAALKKNYQARALRALGLLLADGTPTVGGGKTF